MLFRFQFAGDGDGEWGSQPDDYKRRRVGFNAEAGQGSGQYSGQQVGFNREGRWSRRAPTKGESDYQGSGRFGFKREAA